MAIILFLLIVIALFILKTPWAKGRMGEDKVKLSAKIQLPAATYYALHNVTLPAHDGTTQIDHIFISRFGVFVVETKNMKGWIFGNESHRQWTQKLFHKTHRFQNPIRQNYKHTETVKAILDIPAEHIHSVVVFVGNCEIKTPMPANVVTGSGLSRYIKSFNEAVISERHAKLAHAKLQAACLAPTRETHKRHVATLKQRFAPDRAKKCPRCGSDMVIRTSKRGPSAGDHFWGCRKFPQCKAILKIQNQ